MIGGLFRKIESRKFRYIPRFYDTKSHDLVNRRIGDSRFAERYVARRKAMNDATEEEWEKSKIDLQSFRAKNKRSDRSINRNTFIIFAILMLFVFIMWMITNPNFGEFLGNE
ncbi:Uncharacterised protein [Candidatus Ornithobacterium hominis]|uniref:Uncharacterized protein n=2 Tax=Candidatus Ornithobacterium hominis TaxID=2497989 RepID=A0A383TW13_9FLAO|nr:hypothetical protein [Candidatus Ornithobacterium hominis]MCT7903768.1 hypothetical protein [Candidatus Ornithobacterium hominis]SZD71111.1 Uncharacterised protein [Candidatus Ornithobacterium hominis]